MIRAGTALSPPHRDAARRRDGAPARRSVLRPGAPPDRLRFLPAARAGDVRSRTRRCGSSTSTRNSLARIGQWPWSRTTIADLLDEARRGRAPRSSPSTSCFPSRTARRRSRRSSCWRRRRRRLIDAADRRQADPRRAVRQGDRGRADGAGHRAQRPRPSPPPPLKAGFAVAGDDPRPFIPGFAGATTQPAGARRGGARASARSTGSRTATR